MATSKRARQIIGGAEPLVDGRGKKPLSIAVEELNKGKVKIHAGNTGRGRSRGIRKPCQRIPEMVSSFLYILMGEKLG